MKNFALELANELKAKFESQEVKDFIGATEKASEEESGSFEVVISTEHLDRYEEVIKLDGWELEHYRKNPVVLWGHDHSQLIGMATSVEIKDGQLVAHGKFAPTAEAQEKRQLYDLGFLRATSVGFIQKERQGNLITKAELLEFSFVSVPANPHALTLAVKSNLNINELVTKGFMTVEGTKGAIQDQQDAVEARQKKWENFSEVDNLICAFWSVYFDVNTPVEDFTKLCTETSELLKKIAGGEKAMTISGVEIKESGMQSVRENVAALKELTEQRIGELAIALEALETEEPERSEEDKKSLKAFEDKKTVQKAATILGDFLAEWRQKDAA